MSSLVAKEGMEGKVQMVYFDPPYGISFNSNMQVSAAIRDTRGGSNVEKLSGEPEMIQGFRDTYKRGIHDFLDTIRENLVLARDLLTESGSLFLQIGKKHVNRLGVVLDEVFGYENRMAMITFVKTGSSSASGLAEVCDYLLWYCKDKDKAKFHQLYEEENLQQKIVSMSSYAMLEYSDGTIHTPSTEQRLNPKDISLVPEDAVFFERMPLTSQHESQGERGQGFGWKGKTWLPNVGRQWSVSQKGLENLAKLNRLCTPKDESSLGWKRYENEQPGTKIHNVWVEKHSANDMHYIVETAEKVVERCLLMSTEPGDIILDITCGSGTTPFVAEKWGRRWIATDASRIPIALARQRILTSVHDWYLLSNSVEGKAIEMDYQSGLVPNNNSIVVDHSSSMETDPSVGFVYERVPYVSAATLAYDRPRTFTHLIDRPYKARATKRIASPFTVESLSPYRTLPPKDVIENLSSAGIDVQNNIVEALATSGVSMTSEDRNVRIEDIEPWSSTDNGLVTHLGLLPLEKKDHNKKTDLMFDSIAISILPEDATCSRTWIREAALKALDIDNVSRLLVIAFNYEADAYTKVEVRGKIKIHCVRANRDLQIDSLKHSIGDQAFIEIGEPDVDIQKFDGNRIAVKLLGYDTFNPRTGNLQSGGENDVACWMIDTNYDSLQFLPRRFHFPGKGGDGQIKRMKTALKKYISDDEWDAMLSLQSTPFSRPSTGKIAVRIITNTCVEMTTVREVG